MENMRRLENPTSLLETLNMFFNNRSSEDSPHGKVCLSLKYTSWMMALVVGDLAKLRHNFLAFGLKFTLTLITALSCMQGHPICRHIPYYTS